MHKSSRLTQLVGPMLLLCTLPAWAVPSFTSELLAFTENFGPNSAGFAAGQFLHFSVSVADPLGVPGNINLVEANALTAGQSSYTLPYVSTGLFGAYDGVFNYTGQMGQWEVKVTNKQNETVTGLTNKLDDVHILPLATNLQATGSLLAPTITWDPILFDDDNNAATPNVEVDYYRIRLLNDPYQQFFQSEIITGHSFTVPQGIIVPGLTYTIRLIANDLDNGALENRSDTFTQFVAVPEPMTISLFTFGIALLGVGGFRRRPI